MKRKISILLAVMLVLSLAGCGTKNTKGESASTKNEAETTKETSKQEMTETTEKEESSAEIETPVPTTSNLLKNYDGLVKIGEYNKIVEVDESMLTVTDEDIDNILLSYLDSYSYGSVEHLEGTVEDGQRINVQINTKVEGVEPYPYEDYITIGYENIAPGIDEQLIGKETGFSGSFDVTFPNDFYDPAVAGKSGTVDILINYICGDAKYTEVNDEFVKEFTYGEYEDVASYKKYLKEEQEKSNLTNYGYEAFYKLVEEAEVIGDISEYVKAESATAKSFYENYKKEMNISEEEFFEQFGYKDAADYEAQINANSKNIVIEKIVTLVLSDELGITVTDEEVKEHKEELLSYGLTEEELSMSYSDEDLALSLLMEKIIPELSELQLD